MGRDENIPVLSIVANEESPIYKKQIKCLKHSEVSLTTLSTGKNVSTTAGSESQNSDSNRVSDYLRLYFSVLKEKSSYDLVHANGGLIAPLAIAQTRRPIVLTLRGSDLAGKYGRVVKRCTQFYDEVIVRNEEMRRELGRDAHIIPAGIDLKQFKPSPQLKAQHAVGWDPSEKHVLFPYPPTRSVKNYPLAELVVEQVDDQYSDGVRLQAVYGVDHGEVPMYMNAADALLLTSHREGSPNTVKEAMACNLPVVATDVGDVRKRLLDVEQSRVCKSEDDLVSALYDVLQSNERSNGREHVRELSLDRMGERILNVYESALANNQEL